MSNAISLKDLDKAKVLAALYNGARAQGLGFLHYDSEPMTTEEAGTHLQRDTYFDYLKGRVMKIDLSGDELDPWLYDRDNGQGAAERIINALRACGDTNPEEAEIQHKEGTRNAAILMKEHLRDESFVEVEGAMLVVNLGTNEFADEFEPKLDEILGEDEDKSK